jgi:hypothetical protein
MANQKVSQLTAATTPLAGTETAYVVQSGSSRKTTVAAIAATAPGTDLTYTAATRTLASSTGADVVLPVATTTDAGLESAADKTKLDSITVDRATLTVSLVRNTTGSGIAKGTPVYVTGSSGVTKLVAPADASLEATAANTLGVTQENIAHNSTGYVVTEGELSGIDTSLLTEGALIFLSETTGAMTSTRPTQPAHGVVLGWCIKTGAGSSGIIYVKVDNGLELNELHDVLITSPATGQVLRRASDGLWKNAALVASDVAGLSGTNTGDVTLAASVADVLSLSGQELQADDPGADRLLFWDDSASKLTHLTLGTGLTITGTTIDAAGGVSDGDKGDITVSASGGTWTIDAGAVTYAKLQDVSATDRILGRSTAGAGVVEEITCTAAGRALLDDADAAAQRTTLSAAGSGAITGSGLTMATARLLGRSTASTGAVEEITVGTGLSLSSGTLSATASGSGTKTLARFTARDNQPPASNFATLDTRNSISVIEFDAATEESSVFVSSIPEGANLASGLLVRIWWMADTATSGNVRWAASFERTGTDLDSDSFDTATELTSAANGTSGIETVAEITCTSIDSLAAGERFRLKIARKAADATNDTMTGDAQLVAVEVRGVA